MADDLSGKIEFYDFTSEDLLAPDPPLAYSIPEMREEIEALLQISSVNKKDINRLKKADQTILDYIDNLPDDYDVDDPSQPPEKWWWHLKAIKERRIKMPTIGM